MYVLLLSKDVVCRHVGRHVPREGVVLLAMVHGVAYRIAGGLNSAIARFVTFGLLLQQHEGGATIPVARCLQLLNKLPAFAANR